jgi:serine/threonine-protein kinase RsbT
MNDGFRKGLRLTFEDRGPGIAEIELAMKYGYANGSGFGVALSGLERLSKELEFRSKPGEGTVVATTRWR